MDLRQAMQSFSRAAVSRPSLRVLPSPSCSLLSRLPPSSGFAPASVFPTTPLRPISTTSKDQKPPPAGQAVALSPSPSPYQHHPPPTSPPPRGPASQSLTSSRANRHPYNYFQHSPAGQPSSPSAPPSYSHPPYPPPAAPATMPTTMPTTTPMRSWQGELPGRLRQRPSAYATSPAARSTPLDLNVHDLAGGPIYKEWTIDDWSKHYLHMANKYAEPHLGVTLGRTVKCNNHTDVGRSLRLLQVLVYRGNVRKQERLQRFHERPGLRKKRLRSERWVFRFKGGFRHVCERVTELRRQGW